MTEGGGVAGDRDMPTTIYLIRHAEHEYQGRILTGRMEGVPLSKEGQRQSERLADRFADVPIRAIYSSPLQRARETAVILANRLGIAIEIVPYLTEFDVGAWTGLTFDALQGDPLWERFNMFRSGTRAPGGESMLEVQSRVIYFLESLHKRHPDGEVCVISHGDVLRAAILHHFDMPIDLFSRFEIEPASVSIIEWASWGTRVMLLNDTAAVNPGLRFIPRV